jgi:hypothetical protein
MVLIQECGHVWSASLLAAIAASMTELLEAGILSDDLRPRSDLIR